MAINPTPNEQLLLELINRARAAPQAEADRLGIGLNDALAPGTIDAGAKQPLAFNEFLLAAARGHSNWMIDTDIFSHTGIDNSTPTQRMQASGYAFAGTSGSGENISFNGSTAPLDLTQSVLDSHDGLFRSAGHRTNLMDGRFKEIGPGIETGDFTQDGMTFKSMLVTENFAFSGNQSWLTGVVIDDKDADRFYDIGEGVGAVGVKAVGQAGTFETTTWGAGGYGLALPAGSYTITFSLGGKQLSSQATIGASNVKLDATLASLGGVEAPHVIDGSPAGEALLGTAEDDRFNGSGGSDTMDGSGGYDNVVYAGARAQFTVSVNGETVTVGKPGDETDTLRNVERVTFNDGGLVFDLEGPNAKAAYLLYGGAFDRTPDEGGVRYWSGEWLDKGSSLHDVALRFLDSDEFRSLFGMGLDDRGFVEQLYQNILHRPGEAAGVDFWAGFLDRDDGDRAEVLVRFTQEAEYVANSQANIENGYWVL